jgi:hypothetical protein
MMELPVSGHRWRKGRHEDKRRITAFFASQSDQEPGTRAAAQGSNVAEALREEGVFRTEVTKPPSEKWESEK